MRTQLEALGIGVRSGADHDEVAEEVGLGGIKMTWAMPTSLRTTKTEATGLEDA